MQVQLRHRGKKLLLDPGRKDADVGGRARPDGEVVAGVVGLGVGEEGCEEGVRGDADGCAWREFVGGEGKEEGALCGGAGGAVGEVGLAEEGLKDC